MKRIGIVNLAGLLVLGCIRPAEDRALLDLEVGHGSATGIELEIAEGHAAIRELSASAVTLWAQAPTLDMTIDRDAPGPFRLQVVNCMPTAELHRGNDVIAASERPRATHCIFDIDLDAGQSALRLATADAETEEPFRIVVMGDIQTAMAEVHEVFQAISETPEVQFVLSTGDVTDKAEQWEYELFELQLDSLSVPFYSTIGNHELTRNREMWHELFGLYSVHFDYKGAHFSFVDSGNASLDPLVHDRLGRWLLDAEDRIHLFGTHYPLLDPVGTRNSAFRSRNEAAKLLGNLADGDVDLTLYGHIHSYYSFENAGIPAYVSGGGGALPERLDGIGRHFLVIDLDPTQSQVVDVSVSRVD